MNLEQRIEQWLWQRDEANIPTIQQRSLPLLRLLYVLSMRIAEGDLSLRAQSLVYTTLLSLVPLLAVSLSVLKAFDVHTQLQPVLLGFVEPLGKSGVEIIARLISFVENMQFGVLGFLGLAMLFYNIVSTLEKIETAFNSIWHNIIPRSVLRRITDYTSVLLVGPVLVVLGLGITATMTSTRFVQAVISIEPFGTAYYYFGLVMPYVLITAAFYFVYIFMPNTKVRPRAALYGAFVAGALWKTIGWGFATFVSNSTQYHAVYSGFAIVLIFMIWIYVAWLIVLLGAQIAFYVQNPVYIRPGPEAGHAMSCTLRERIGLALMLEIAQRFHAGQPPLNVAELAERLELPLDRVEAMVQRLRQAHWIAETDDVIPAYMPARDLSTLRLTALLASIRGNDGEGRVEMNWNISPVARALHARVETMLMSGLGEETVASVLQADPATVGT